MDKKQEELFVLEKKHFETEQMLSSCHDREKEKIKEQFDREQESIEQKHKDFDDLEFKQLEVNFLYFSSSLHIWCKNVIRIDRKKLQKVNEICDPVSCEASQYILVHVFV